MVVQYVPKSLPQNTKINPQRKLGIYVGYESLSIIKKIFETRTGDSFTKRFDDCNFDDLV